MAVRAYNAVDEDPENPYNSAGAGSDNPNADPNAPPTKSQTAQNPDIGGSTAIEKYTPPTTAATPPEQKPESPDSPSGTQGDLPPVRTFAQMEGEGQARPPVPESQPAITGLLTGGDVQQPIGDPGIINQPGLQPYIPPGPPQLAPITPSEPTDILPPPPIGAVGDQPIQPYVPPGPPQLAPVDPPPEDLWGHGDAPPIQPYVPPGPPQLAPVDPPPEDLWGHGDAPPIQPPQGGEPVDILPPPPIGAVGDQPNDPSQGGPPDPENLWGGHDAQPAQPLGGGPQQPISGGTDNPTTGLPALPGAVDPIVSLLTGGASGTNTTPLQDATTKATLDQLNNPNPYNADEVKREYADLGAGIDADYDQRQRGVSNDFARRGLFGSVGKDFASGRASDTEIGRRSAKEQLASSLATAQAQSAAQAKRDAISQGQAGTQQGQGNQLAWLQQLMGYGNDAFNHDLQTANFQEGQNNDEQDYLLKLLQAGYGV